MPGDVDVDVGTPQSGNACVQSFWTTTLLRCLVVVVAPAQHVHALYTRCEEFKQQVFNLTEKLQQQQYEFKLMKEELENNFQQQLDAIQASRASSFHYSFPVWELA